MPRLEGIKLEIGSWPISFSVHYFIVWLQCVVSFHLLLLSWSIMSSFIPSVFMLFSGCQCFELLNLSFLMSLWHPSASRRCGDSAVLPLAPRTGRLSVLYICQLSIYMLWSCSSGIEITSLLRGHTVPWLIWKEIEVKCRGKRRVWTCRNTWWTINANLFFNFYSISMNLVRNISYLPLSWSV